MPDLVELDRDHPGFKDPAYRARRNAIAAKALAHRTGAKIEEIDYTPEELSVWNTALTHLEPLHRQFGCEAYLRAWPGIGFRAGHIPSFDEVNERLSVTGFRLEPVAGLVEPRQFMEALEGGVFLATQYMRHHSFPLYTPEPDVIHEFIGHVPLLADERFANVNRLFGRATRLANAQDVERLIRVYWYALEFGVVGSVGDYKVIGAGLFSSFGELGRFAKSTLLPFDLDRIASTPFDPTDYQSTLFVGESTDHVLASLERWLGLFG